MRLFFSLKLLVASAFLFSSCSNNNDGIYVSTSGEGSVVIDYGSPSYLYRMVLFTVDTQQDIYLMGYSAYVNADAEFKGQGAVVRLTIPNNEESSTLEAQSFDIASDGYAVSYSPYVNYSAAEGEEDFASIESGTVIIRKSGSFYDVRLLGTNQEGQNVIVAYRGYIYRTLSQSPDAAVR
ncbi:MAG: hypothetical protein SNF93_07780 [Rikenellaceae bacterium]